VNFANVFISKQQEEIMQNKTYQYNTQHPT